MSFRSMPAGTLSPTHTKRTMSDPLLAVSPLDGRYKVRERAAWRDALLATLPPLVDRFAYDGHGMLLFVWLFFHCTCVHGMSSRYASRLLTCNNRVPRRIKRKTSRGSSARWRTKSIAAWLKSSTLSSSPRPCRNSRISHRCVRVSRPAFSNGHSWPCGRQHRRATPQQLRLCLGQPLASRVTPRVGVFF
jgi:hypothetical protein